MIFSFQSDKILLSEYLINHGFINADENVLELEKPGEGNMNFVARIRTEKRSIIVKQANPFVQKYPQIAAPQERIKVEREFYSTIHRNSQLSQMMPALIGLDEENHVLVLQDLGVASDFTYLYQKGKKLSNDQLTQLIQFLNELHAIPHEDLKGYSKNLSLRTLNHEHLFNYPFMENNAFDLDQVQPGLEAASLSYKTDKLFKRKVQQLGMIYLSEGNTLLQGDYYPGSWLKANGQVKIIDPEFSFVGHKEIELGIFIGHLMLCEASSEIKQVESHYNAGNKFNWKLCFQFAGVEIMRRIIGLAQLPLDLTLPEKEHLLKEGYNFITKQP